MILTRKQGGANTGRSLEETTVYDNHSKIVYYGSKEFIEQCITAYNIEAVKKGSNRQKPMSGAYGHVFKIKISGVSYFIKAVVRKNPDAKSSVEMPPRSADQKKTDAAEYGYQQWELINEIEVSKFLTMNIPQSVSVLYGAYLKHDANFTRSFLIYEAPEGVNLAEYIKSIPEEEKLEACKYLYCEIKRIQNDINRVGFVHRDIKPENIYVIIGMERPHCKLIDFGTTVPIGYTGRISGSILYLPEDMKPKRLRKKNISGYEGPAITRQNDFAVDTIWTKDFKLDSSLIPKCSGGGSRRKRK